MTQPYIGEIQVFALIYAPRGYALCNGAEIPVQQNPELYSLIGTTYGGGANSFRLPNFGGQALCGDGAGPGLVPRAVGHGFGLPAVALDEIQMAPHSHAFRYFTQNDGSKRSGMPQAGAGMTVPSKPEVLPFTQSTDSLGAGFHPAMVAGGGQGIGHENRQPYLALNFCIALQGVYPASN